MTTKTVGDGTSVKVEPSEDSNATVTREAHERLLTQRKADRARAQAAEDERDRLKAQVEEAEAAKMAADKRYQELAESEKQKRIAAEAKTNELIKANQESTKRSALMTAIGALKKPEYIGFAPIASVVLNPDGTVDESSVKEIANKFKESYPDLLAVTKTGQLPNGAPKDPTAPKPKALTEMSAAELKEAYRIARATN